MAVMRCPHCNKPNPDFLDVCQYCDQPLAADGQVREDPGDQLSPTQEPVRALSEWDTFDAQSGQTAEPADNRIEIEPAGDEQAAPAGDTVPDWLAALDSAPPAGQSDLPATQDNALPDWLGALDAETDSAEISAPAGSPDPRLPDWLGDDPADEGGPTGSVAWADRDSDSAGPDSAPDQAEDAATSPAAALPDWLSALQPAESPELAAAPDKPELPDWLRDDASGGAEGPSDRAAEPPSDWGAESAGPASAWLSEVTELEPEGVRPDEPEPALPVETPDWLQTRGSSDADVTGQTSRPADQPALEQADLPAWLSAMRPVDVQAPAGSADDGDQYQEAIGVLAGMRGVLRAEPSVVLPGKSATPIHTLTMTDSQARAALVLAAIARADTVAAGAKTRRPFRLPLMRWVLTLALIAGALTPFILPGLFAPPQMISLMTQAAVTTIEGLEATGPVLVAIDYEPGQAGELDPAASAILRHIMRQGLPVVTVSTSPSGAGLAQRMLAESAGQAGLSEYTHFVNLGYISGGPVGVLAFGISPRSVFLADFSGSGEVWQSAALHGVNRLDDFSAVIVISGSPESARAWIEQTQLLLNSAKPFVVATSAGADPLLRPFTASAGGPIDGYIAGLGGVAQYERMAGLEGEGQNRFAQIGAVLWIAAAAIVLGNALSVLRHVRLKRQ